MYRHAIELTDGKKAKYIGNYLGLLMHFKQHELSDR